MNLKQYQQHSLHWLPRYYQTCRSVQDAVVRGDMPNGVPASMAFTPGDGGDSRAARFSLRACEAGAG